MKPHIPYGNVDYGFRMPILASDHYHLGAAQSLVAQVRRPDGKWKAFAPDYEAQADLYETQGCTVWGTQNIVETMDREAGKKTNYAEIFTYIKAGISPDGGGDPHAVAESIRKDGLVDQSYLPMPVTLEEFTDPHQITDKLNDIGHAWVDQNAFGHEWVFTTGRSKEERTALMRQSLRYSPLGASVSAWILEGDVYVDDGMPNNHWVEILEETATGWLAFDSYDTSFKTVSFDHDIQFCKRYSLKSRKPASRCPQSFCEIVKNLLHLNK